MLKAVLFDMDGVIVDTEPLHRKAYFKMFEEVNIEVSDAMYDAFTGQATLPICTALCQHFELSCPPGHLVATKRKHFKKLFENDSDLELLVGVHDLIIDYYNNGLTLVLASSASMVNINRIFDRFDLNEYFKAKISGADLRASKPHPEIFIKAAELAGEHRDDCMVIEDSTNGIAAAKAAEIYCVAFKSPHSANQDYSKADRVITDFGEIAFRNLSNL